MNEAVISALSAGLAILLVKVFDFVMAYVKSQREGELTDREAILKEYRDLVDELQSQVSALKAEAKELHRLYVDCRVENAILQQRVTYLEERLREANSKGGNTNASQP